MIEKKSTLYYYDQLVIYAPKMFIKFGSAANVSNINIAPFFILPVLRKKYDRRNSSRVQS